MSSVVLCLARLKVLRLLLLLRWVGIVMTLYLFVLVEWPFWSIRFATPTSKSSLNFVGCPSVSLASIIGAFVPSLIVVVVIGLSMTSLTFNYFVTIFVTNLLLILVLDLLFVLIRTSIVKLLSILEPPSSSLHHSKHLSTSVKTSRTIHVQLLVLLL